MTTDLEQMTAIAQQLEEDVKHAWEIIRRREAEILWLKLRLEAELAKRDGSVRGRPYGAGLCRSAR